MTEEENYKKAIFVEVLLSSSSSSSSDEEQFVQFHRKSVPKINNYIEDVVHKFDNQQFKSNFRMRRDTAYMLIEKFSISRVAPHNESHGGRIPLSAEVHILSFLWFSGNKSSLRDVSQRFNMSLSSLFRVIDRVNDFLIDMGPSVIKMPTSDTEKENVAAEFQKISGFPGVLGCIDGTSIHIRKPAHKIKSTYTNRHDIPSITLQAICDYNKKFIDIFTGVPGKIHDARVLKLSDIFATLPTLCGTRYHIIGDSAYFIRPWLLTPFKDFGNMPESQNIYNNCFKKTRVLIENTFGILKGRFRQLLQLDMQTTERNTKFIIACCILHNLCMDSHDIIDESEIIDASNAPAEPCQEVEWRLRKKGEEKRETIKTILEYNNN